MCWFVVFKEHRSLHSKRYGSWTETFDALLRFDLRDIPYELYILRFEEQILVSEEKFTEERNEYV